METLEAYDWPGNVRELINTLEKAILADREAPTLFPMHLPRPVRLRFIQSNIDEKRGKFDEASSGISSSTSERFSISINITYPPPARKHLRDQVTELLANFSLRYLMPVPEMISTGLAGSRGWARTASTYC